MSKFQLCMSFSNSNFLISVNNLDWNSNEKSLSEDGFITTIGEIILKSSSSIFLASLVPYSSASLWISEKLGLSINSSNEYTPIPM